MAPRLYSALGFDIVAILRIWLFIRSIRLSRTQQSLAEAQYSEKFKLKFIRILMTHSVDDLLRWSCVSSPPVPPDGGRGLETHLRRHYRKGERADDFILYHKLNYGKFNLIFAFYFFIKLFALFFTIKFCCKSVILLPDFF